MRVSLNMSCYTQSNEGWLLGVCSVLAICIRARGTGFNIILDLLESVLILNFNSQSKFAIIHGFTGAMIPHSTDGILHAISVDRPGPGFAEVVTPPAIVGSYGSSTL